MGRVTLHRVEDKGQLEEILEIQKKAFKSLYEKYKDEETSPYKESITDIGRRFLMESSYYYFIQLEETRVGFIRIVLSVDQTKARISPIAILPEYESRGYGKQAMLEVEQLFSGVKEWHLDTIKQEEKLGAFYSKLGYQKLEKEEKIHDAMVISFFSKSV